MAPEQAKGKVADGRADVWAFGCVLYEMLTGRRAFAGDTVSETLASVLTREPALDALPSGWPASGRRLLRRCFEREPRRRLRDVSEGLLLVEEDLARSDEAEPVVSAAPPQVAVVRHALPDGQTLLVGVNPGGGLDLHTLAFGQDTQTEPLLAESDYREYMPHVSPNGRWLAYTSDESGRSEVYVRPFPDVEAGRKWTITGDGGGAPVWSDDGTKLFFQQPTSREMFVVSVETDGPVFTPGIPDVLFDGPYLYASRVEARNRAWDIAHDGRFLMIKENASGDIVVVLNWLQELEERVPVD